MDHLMAPSTAPSVAVVMPYYRNERTLVPCVQSFVEQSGAQVREIIVVDDGDSPTAQDLLASHPWPLPVTALRSERQGQSAATNLGIEAATSDIVLLTCADTIAASDLVVRHLQTRGDDPDVAVLGHIAYAPWIEMTPIMAYLASAGVQFNFANMVHGTTVSGSLMYAPNVSVSRARLMEAGLFDSTLTYGYQDCDLGLKLEAKGVKFVYNQKAVVWHDHPNSVRGFVNRQIRVNTLWHKMARRYPKAAQLDSMVAQLDHFVPMLPKLPHITQLAERADAAGWPPPDATQEAQQRLFALFGTLGSLAMMQGIVSDLKALGEVIDVRQRPWYRDLAGQGALPLGVIGH